MASLSTSRRARNAFSLTELLVVVAVMALLGSLGVVSLSGSAAAQLSGAGSRLATLIEQARGQAILQRQPTALVMLASGDGVANRVFAILGYAVSSTGVGSWQRLTKWETLPQGVLADKGTDGAGNALGAFLPSNSPSLDPALPALSYNGSTFSARADYGYVVFMADGSLYQDSAGSLPTPCVLRLVEGVYQQGSIHYTSAQGTGRSQNYFEIALNQATGQAKITRP